MKSIQLIIIILFCTLSAAKAQDSTKVVYQEVGFNTVSLVRQLISNNPSNTLNQLPYDVFYNAYYKDLIGVRVGLGILNMDTETDIQGQTTGRTTQNTSLNLRLGASYNFVKSNRLTLNVFGDFVSASLRNRSVNTQTTQTFGNPVQVITVISESSAKGAGFQGGVGVKFNVYKHLSLYAEVPLTYMIMKSTDEDTQITSGVSTVTTNSKETITTTNITLPTTIYLVLRF